MFLRAWKLKKIAESVLAQVQPDMTAITRLVGRVPQGLGKDKYILGYFCTSIAIALVRPPRRLNNVDTGLILKVVIERMFGLEAPDHQFLAGLLNAVPKDVDFALGGAAAEKIQGVLAGFPEFQNDPDVIAAREAMKHSGSSLDYLSPGADDNSKIAAHLIHKLLYQRVLVTYTKQ